MRHRRLRHANLELSPEPDIVDPAVLPHAYGSLVNDFAPPNSTLRRVLETSLKPTVHARHSSERNDGDNLTLTGMRTFSCWLLVSRVQTARAAAAPLALAESGG